MSYGEEGVLRAPDHQGRSLDAGKQFVREQQGLSERRSHSRSAGVQGEPVAVRPRHIERVLLHELRVRLIGPRHLGRLETPVHHEPHRTRQEPADQRQRHQAERPGQLSAQTYGIDHGQPPDALGMRCRKCDRGIAPEGKTCDVCPFDIQSAHEPGEVPACELIHRGLEDRPAGQPEHGVVRRYDPALRRERGNLPVPDGASRPRPVQQQDRRQRAVLAGGWRTVVQVVDGVGPHVDEPTTVLQAGAGKQRLHASPDAPVLW